MMMNKKMLFAIGIIVLVVVAALVIYFVTKKKSHKTDPYTTQKGTDYLSFDIEQDNNTTLEKCKQKCLNTDNCAGFVSNIDATKADAIGTCWYKPYMTDNLKISNSANNSYVHTKTSIPAKNYTAKINTDINSGTNYGGKRSGLSLNQCKDMCSTNKKCSGFVTVANGSSSDCWFKQGDVTGTISAANHNAYIKN